MEHIHPVILGNTDAVQCCTLTLHVFRTRKTVRRRNSSESNSPLKVGIGNLLHDCIFATDHAINATK